jgi:hypothetical protein
VIGTDPGDWRPIGWPAAPVYDPDGWVGNLKLFLIESPSQFRSEGPNALTSDEYTNEFNEVKELGALNSTKRSEDQTKAAVFWQFAPIALWNPLARGLADRYDLDAADQGSPSHRPAPNRHADCGSSSSKSSARARPAKRPASMAEQGQNLEETKTHERPVCLSYADW